MSVAAARCSLLLVALAPLLPAQFEHEVLPWLQKQGCASAYCHGSASGQGGFKLSLFGSDAAADWETIVLGHEGRRLDLREPEQSLLLQKPTLALRHGGGRRLQTDSAAWRALRAWIDAGAAYRDEQPAALARLELVAAPQGFRALASFERAGAAESRDVTALALWNSTDPRVATVGDDGQVTQLGAGITWITARYGNLTERAEVVVPFAEPQAPPVIAHPLAAAWRAHLARLGLEAPPKASSWLLARRLHLDLAGRVPTEQELAEFLADPDPGRTADRLFARPEFAEVWARHFADWLELPPQLRSRVELWLAQQIPANELVRRLLAGPASPNQFGDTGSWLARIGDPRDRAELVARSLLGIRVGCARCHDHPLDRWRMDEHLAFSACFASPRAAPEGAMTQGELFAPDGSVVTPLLLPLGNLDRAPGDDRRAAIAAFVLDESHGMFARNLANRLHATLFGRGLVEPVDDHRAGNPAVDEAMLDVLADTLRAADCDLRAGLRLLVTSGLYAASSRPGENPQDAQQAELLARRSVRALTPELWSRAVAWIAGAEAPAPPGSPLSRELALLNGELLHHLLARGTVLDAPADLGGDAGEQIDWLYRTILSRPPTAAERAHVSSALGERRHEDWRRLAYALLAGREFGMVR